MCRNSTCHDIHLANRGFLADYDLETKRKTFMMDLLFTDTEIGLYCHSADLFIDPQKPVKRAIFTHAHADHAREGCREVWAHKHTLEILKARWSEFPEKAHHLDYDERFFINGLRFSLHSAGHILGSSQVLIEAAGERWLISGDYKRQRDPSCEAFSTVTADIFISEATFALPVFEWQSPDKIARQIAEWVNGCIEQDKQPILYCYSLGKTQRLMMELKEHCRFSIHESAAKLCEVYEASGIELPDYQLVTKDYKSSSTSHSLMIMPPMMQRSKILKNIKKREEAFASGWMNIRGMKRRRALEKGFVVSDHADWPALVETVKQSQAKKVFVTHGYNDILARYLSEDLKIEAHALKVLRQDEEGIL